MCVCDRASNSLLYLPGKLVDPAARIHTRIGTLKQTQSEMLLAECVYSLEDVNRTMRLLCDIAAHGAVHPRLIQPFTVTMPTDSVHSHDNNNNK